MSSLIRLAAVCAVLTLVRPAHASVELAVHFSVIEQLVSRELFLQDGRKYVRGSPGSRCSFAYLAQPRIAGSAGKLAISAHFTGRSAVDVLGQCIGLGDDFDLVVFAVPYYRQGRLAFKEVSVATHSKDTFYTRRVRKALSESFERDITYAIEDQARKTLEQPQPGAFYGQKLSDFQVSRVTITADALVLSLDFRLAVK